MYNRYIRSEDGSYTRVSEEEPRQAPPPPQAPWGEASTGGGPSAKSGPSAGNGPFVENGPPPFGGVESIAAYLRRVLDQLHLDRIDTGDLLLLGLLYFLFREKADEELLVALGLLLIL